jgi:hypothetical protein
VDAQNRPDNQQFELAFTELRDACDMIDSALRFKGHGPAYLMLIYKLASSRVETLEKCAGNSSVDISRKKMAAALCQQTTTLLGELQTALQKQTQA